MFVPFSIADFIERGDQEPSLALALAMAAALGTSYYQLFTLPEELR